MFAIISLEFHSYSRELLRLFGKVRVHKYEKSLVFNIETIFSYEKELFGLSKKFKLYEYFTKAFGGILDLH